MPFRAAKAEAMLAGVPLAGHAFETALREAADEVARGCHPVDDLYGSGEYKRHLAMVFTTRAITAARDSLQGEATDDGE
jgi:carbon-monoxide dehydrogenase medium subunit